MWEVLIGAGGVGGVGGARGARGARGASGARGVRGVRGARVCEEARQHGFASVCVNSTWIGLTARLLDGCRTMPICVVGFPLGAMATRSKALETREAIADGAEEIDMVIATFMGL